MTRNFREGARHRCKRTRRRHVGTLEGMAFVIFAVASMAVLDLWLFVKFSGR